MILPDGVNYVGESKNGVPNGQGTITLSDGGNYIGEFKNGKPNGQGTCLLYTSPSPRDVEESRMPSSA